MEVKENQTSCVYFYYKEEKLLYIGKTHHFFTRHVKRVTARDEVVLKYDKVKVNFYSSPFIISAIESYLIAKYQPPYNIKDKELKFKEDPFIETSIKYYKIATKEYSEQELFQYYPFDKELYSKEMVEKNNKKKKGGRPGIEKINPEGYKTAYKLYTTTNLTLRQIEERTGVAKSIISRRAASENWVRFNGS